MILALPILNRVSYQVYIMFLILKKYLIEDSCVLDTRKVSNYEILTFLILAKYLTESSLDFKIP